MTLAPARNLGVQGLAAVWRLAAEATRIVAFLVAGGALSLQLSGLDLNAPVGADSTSARSQLAVGLALGVLILSGASGWRRVLPLMKANAPLLALPVLAILSVLWAPEPVVALRRAFAFALTLVGAVSVVARLPGASALRFLVRAVVTAVLLSIAYVALSPGYGVHQMTDGAQSVHAGDWRGLFVHRTALGQMAALSLGLTLYAGSHAFGPTARVGAILASLLCLVMAHSGGGWFSAVILVAFPPLWTFGRHLTRWNGPMTAALAVAALTLAGLLAPMLTPLVLHLLGKDATLTGRTNLWRMMAQAAGQKPWLGYGYGTGFRSIIAGLIQAHSPYGYVPNAQNGYLDVVLNLGLAGLGLALAALGLAVWRAVRLALEPNISGLAFAPLLIVVFIVEMNGVEAALISANDIFVLIYATATIASGKMLEDRLRRRVPQRSAIHEPGDCDEGQIDRQRLQP
jgi:exopolysaccharide production protein ExoQ